MVKHCWWRLLECGRPKQDLDLRLSRSLGEWVTRKEKEKRGCWFDWMEGIHLEKADGAFSHTGGGFH